MDLGKVTRSKLHSGIKLDFYLHEHNVALEVHGIQHYQPSGFGADDASTLMSYTRQLYRDDRLRELCAKYKIKLIEIPYNMGYVDILTCLNEETK